MQSFAFSIVNCLIAANCWMISKRRDVAIRKAFGWSNRKLSVLITKKMAVMLAVGFVISTMFLAVLGASGNEFLQIDFSPFFLLGTSVMLLFTLFLSVLVPMRHVLSVNKTDLKKPAYAKRLITVSDGKVLDSTPVKR